MEKTNTPLARWGEKVKQNWKKILIVFTCILVLFSSILAVVCPQYKIGFKYVENDTTEIGITQIENFDALVLRNYLCQLQGDGFEIESGEIDDSVSSHWGIYKKESINQQVLEENLRNDINVKVAIYQLIVPDDEIIYCFKNESECQAFKEKINAYNSKLEMEIQKTIGETSDISSGDILENKLNKLEEEKQAEIARQEALAAAAAKKKTVSVSRSSNIKRGSSSCCVLSSYVYVSSYYGMRSGKMHTGVDLATSSGTPILAWKDGTVTQASWNSQGYGNFIIIDHGDGTVSRYAHLSGYAVAVGNTVTKGQVIGYVGSTGNSTGPHLHWEILINGNFVNPFSYL